MVLDTVSTETAAISIERRMFRCERYKARVVRSVDSSVLECVLTEGLARDRERIYSERLRMQADVRDDS